MTKILLVDDHPIVRQGLTHVLSQSDRVEALEQAESGEEAVYLAKKFDPDVILMDIKMDGLDGIETAKIILKSKPNVKIIGLSSFETAETLQQMQLVGACGFLFKDIDGAGILEAIERVLRGEKVFPNYPPTPDKERNIEVWQVTSSEKQHISKLTQQQKQILTFICKGLTNPEISQQMGFSVSTARYHVSTIFEKLDVSNRAEAVALAIQYKLTDNDVC